MDFVELNKNELELTDGGVAASAVLVIISGVCYIGAGISALCGNKKLAAGFTVVGGCCDVAAGVCMLLP
ncbi:MAG: hypothetical protein K6F65_04035 [Lachnospiraceae bacterium]|nr:hypothetical protein [Lachnospiraceae bacterium]